MYIYRPVLLLLSSALLAACVGGDSDRQIQNFCSTLEQVNDGSIDTSGLSELEGHALVIKTLLDQSHPDRFRYCRAQNQKSS